MKKHGTVVKNPPANAGGARDTGSIPGLGRFPGVGNGNPLQYEKKKKEMEQNKINKIKKWNSMRLSQGVVNYSPQTKSGPQSIFYKVLLDHSLAGLYTQMKHRLHRLQHQFSSVAQSCPTLCDPMKFSTPGLPVHHQLPELTQTHAHRGGDAIQPSHPLSSPPPPAPNPSQHQGLFQ